MFIDPELSGEPEDPPSLRSPTSARLTCYAMLLVLKQSLLIKAHIGSLDHQNLATNNKALDRQDGIFLIRFLFLLSSTSYFAAMMIFPRVSLLQA
jgi:hypothetical protein